MEIQKKPAVLIAAVKSGSGKTTFTCTLLEALKQRQLNPRAFKCGPDYIDSMFHKTVIGIPSDNLDSFFATEDQLKSIFVRESENNGISVVEGAMGLYDGLGGISEEGSAYHIASVLDIPVILVVDAHGMGRSVIPLLSGFLQYDRKKLIKGVVLNKVTPSFCSMIAPVIEKELGIEVLGCFPKLSDFNIESRHLGLKIPEEIQDLKEKLRTASEVLENNVKINRLIDIASTDKKDEVTRVQGRGVMPVMARIAVARDEAFCFYYEENLRVIKEQGGEPIFFSPLHDEKLPENIDGMILGGGYPELYAEKLEENESMRKSIRDAIDDGIPSIAECGGFMYLHEMLEDQEHRTYQMCGALQGRCFYTGKLVRFGYVEIKEKDSDRFGKTGIKAHEFHYFDSENNGDCCIAKKPVTGKTWNCIHSDGRKFWGFPHLYYRSNTEFAAEFIRQAIKYKKERQEKING